MAEKLDKLLVLTEMNDDLHMDNYFYTEGKISSQGSGHFGDKVKKDYKAQAAYHIIGIDDIDDTRNGLPLWKPIEWAFDTSR